MASKMQEWVEKVKVVTPGLTPDGPSWQPTPNERNTLMLKEARTYSHALQSMHRDLTNWDKNVKVTLNSISLLLRTGLPRIFDEAASGAAFPATREHRLVASDVPTEVLASASALLREKMARDVLKPLEQWQEAYKKIRDDNEKVEELRNELDHRRRSHAQVQYKVDKLTAVVTSPRSEASPTPTAEETKAEAKHEAKTEKLEEKTVQLATESDKTERMVQRYTDAEAHVFQSIYALIQDVHVLRDYAAAAITLMQEAFASSLRAFQDGPAAAAAAHQLEGGWASSPAGSVEGGPRLGSFVGRSLPVKSPLQDGTASGRASQRSTQEEVAEGSDGRAQLNFASPLGKGLNPNATYAVMPVVVVQPAV